MKPKLTLVIKVRGAPGLSATIDDPPFIPSLGDYVFMPDSPPDCEIAGTVHSRAITIARNAVTTVHLNLHQ